MSLPIPNHTGQPDATPLALQTLDITTLANQIRAMTISKLVLTITTPAITMTTHAKQTRASNFHLTTQANLGPSFTPPNARRQAGPPPPTALSAAAPRVARHAERVNAGPCRQVGPAVREVEDRLNSPVAASPPDLSFNQTK